MWIWIQILPWWRFRPVYRPGIPVYRPVWPVYRPVLCCGSLRYTDRLHRYTGRFGQYTGCLEYFFAAWKIDSRCEIKGNFDMSYAHFNVNDPTKAMSYNYAYKYNSNRVHTNTESYTYTHEMKVQRRNGKTPIWDAVWYSAVDIKAIPRTLSSSAL